MPIHDTGFYATGVCRTLYDYRLEPYIKKGLTQTLYSGSTPRAVYSVPDSFGSVIFDSVAFI